MRYTHLITGETRTLEDWSCDLLAWGKDMLDAMNPDEMGTKERSQYHAIEAAVHTRDLDLLAAMNQLEEAY